MEDTEIPNEEQHLCVLIHGFWGNPNHLDVTAEALRDKHAQNLHILIAKSNSGSLTYDGIELGGERVCQEIEEEIQKLALSGHIIKKLSFVGYSLGGLIARYAVGLLESKRFFEGVKPVNFTTFVTPHLGVRAPLRGWHSTMWNVFGARTLLRSGQQLFLIDSFRQVGRPLLEILADPNSIFMQALAKFKRRTLYTNIVNDRSAVYYTTAISKTDPFANLDLEKVNLTYLKGYEDIILDPDASLNIGDVRESGVTPSTWTIIRRLLFLVAMVTYIPFGILTILINSGIEALGSSRRIHLYEQGLGDLQPSKFEVLLTGIQEAVEDIYKNVNSAQSHEYLVSSDDEAAMEEGMSSFPNEQQPLLSREESDAKRWKTHQIEGGAPILALAPCQFQMIQALDNVRWRKYAVHIHNAKHSHAAIIVRSRKPSFEEGKIVLRHWVEEEFIV